VLFRHSSRHEKPDGACTALFIGDTEVFSGHGLPGANLRRPNLASEAELRYSRWDSMVPGKIQCFSSMFWLRFNEKHNPTSGDDPCDRLVPDTTFGTAK
jgi:hypothetical protein